MTDAPGAMPASDPADSADNGTADAGPEAGPADSPDDPATSPDERRDAGAARHRGDDAGLGWRALAGSLDDVGFDPPPAARTVPSDRPTPAVEEVPADHGPTASGHPRARQFSRGAVTLVLVQLTLGIIIVGGFTVKLYDKAVIAPGTTADIEEFVDVRDHGVYASDATISLVSVRTSFAPTLFEVVGGWLDGALEVVDVHEILGERTVSENREAGRMQMDQSTQIAVAVALEHLGHEIMTPIGARVERIMRDAPADDALYEGDIVQAVDAMAITTAQQLSETIKAREPGSTTTLTALDPDGGTRAVTVTLADRDGVALLGVLVTTHVEFDEPPVDVTLRIDNIGGPSAGLAFTLSVIDALTPEPLTGDLDVAATGTIGYDGSVGPIGGLAQKSHAVIRAGTDLFLVPAAQVDAAIAVAAPSVDVVGVETLEDALAAIAARRT